MPRKKQAPGSQPFDQHAHEVRLLERDDVDQAAATAGPPAMSELLAESLRRGCSSGGR